MKKSSSSFLFILCVLALGVGILIFASVGGTSTPTPQSVAEILRNPAYNTQITAQGEVTRLGELVDPCFYLVSEGAELEVCPRPENLYSYPENPPQDSIGWGFVQNGALLNITGELTQNEKTGKPLLWVDLIRPAT